MELGDIWVKIANNLRLSQQEQEFLRLEGRNTQQRNTFVAGNTSADGLLAVAIAFEPIFSEVLQIDVASININIPPKYKHLFIMGAGRNTGTGGALNEVFLRFNNDAAANYTQQKTMVIDTTTYPASYASQTGCIVGITSNSDLAAQNASYFFTIVPHCHSKYTKNTIMFGMAGYANLRYVGSVWSGTDPVSTITLLDTDAGVSLAAGTAISVYGMV